jgi:hypothetical protein
MEQRHRDVHVAPPVVPLIPIIKMLRDLCEDHHPAMQAAMYEQQRSCGTSRSVNLVQEALKLVECFAKTEQRVDAMDTAGAFKLLAVFGFLIEASQGPCFRNQELLAKSELVECCKAIFTSSFKTICAEADALAKSGRGGGGEPGTISGGGGGGGDGDGGGGGGGRWQDAWVELQRPAIAAQVQAKAMKTLATVAEGRRAPSLEPATGGHVNVHDQLAQKLETSLLRLRLVQCHEKMQALAADAKVAERRHTWWNRTKEASSLLFGHQKPAAVKGNKKKKEEGQKDGGNVGEDGVASEGQSFLGCTDESWVDSGDRGAASERGGIQAWMLEPLDAEKMEELVLTEARDLLQLVRKLQDCSEVAGERIKEAMTTTVPPPPPAYEHVETVTEEQLEYYEQVAYADAHEYFMERLQLVEFVWHGQLEQLLFVQPPLVKMHTQMDQESTLKEIDFMSSSRMMEFIRCNDGKKRELEQASQMKQKYPLFQLLSGRMHNMPALTFAVAAIINLAMVLSAQYPDGLKNSWYTNANNVRSWNTNGTVHSIDAETGKPLYNDGTGFLTFVRGGEMQDHNTPSRPDVYAWEQKGVDAEGLLFGLGILLFVLLLLQFGHGVASAGGMCYEDMLELGENAGGNIDDDDDDDDDDDPQAQARRLQRLREGRASNGQGGGGGGDKADEGRRNAAIPELVRRHLQGEEGAGATTGFARLTRGLFIPVIVLAVLAGRYGGRIPAPPYIAAMILMYAGPNFLMSAHRLLIKHKPWVHYPLPQFPSAADSLGPRSNSGVIKNLAAAAGDIATGVAKPSLMSSLPASWWWLSEVDPRALVSSGLFSYCLSIEALLYKNNLQRFFSLLLSALATFGGYPFFYCLLTLLVVNTSKPMQTAVMALSSETRAMLMSMLTLLVIIVYIFSAFAFFFLNGDLYSNGGGSECDTLLDCWLTLLSTEMLSGGSMGGRYADSWTEDGGDLLFMGWADTSPDLEVGTKTNFGGHDARSARFVLVYVFELMFFIVMLVMLLNMVFGIIIDRFAELRDDKRDNDRARAGTCFVCGIDRETFEQDGATRSGELHAFRTHVQTEHNMWSYFSCQVYLLTKDSKDFSGAESYLAKCLAEQSAEWVPINRALRLGERSPGAAASAAADATPAPAPAAAATTAVAAAAAGGGGGGGGGAAGGGGGVVARADAPADDGSGLAVTAPGLKTTVLPAIVGRHTSATVGALPAQMEEPPSSAITVVREMVSMEPMVQEMSDLKSKMASMEEQMGSVNDKLDKLLGVVLSQAAKTTQADGAADEKEACEVPCAFAETHTPASVVFEL